MTTKTAIFLTIFLFLSMFTGCGKKEVKLSNKISETKYIVYYFHPTARCESCINMESYIKELIETKYADKGFSFKEVNIEQEENEHYRKDYELKFSSVILSKVETDKQTKWRNLDSVWSYTDNKEKFFNYTEREIINFINSN
jgi:hypothetical protein